jgi:membrane protease YdiL (CAAX protease family)
MTFPQADDGSRETSIVARGGVPWTWADLAVGVAAILVLLFFLSLAALPVLLTYGEDSDEGRFTAAVINGLWYAGSIILVYLIVQRRGAGWGTLGFRPPPGSPPNRWLSLLGAVFVFLFVAYGLVILYGLFVELFGLDLLEPGQQIPDESYDSAAVIAAMGFLVVLGAPVAEEVLFRGFIFAKLRMHMPFVVAAAISGGVFSLAHLDLGLILPFTLVGMLLAYVYERTGTLWGSIGVHFCFNTITFLVLLLVPDAR